MGAVPGPPEDEDGPRTFTPGEPDARPTRRWERPFLALVVLVAIVATGLRLGVVPRARRDSGSGATRQRSHESPPPARQTPPAIEIDAGLPPGVVAATGPEAAPAPRIESPTAPVLVPEGPIAPTMPPPPPEPVPETTPAPTPAPPVAVADADESPRRIRVKTDSGRIVVARVHGACDDEVSVVLPDGQIGLARSRSLVATDEPFRPATADEMRHELSDGPFAGFQVRQSAHYLVFYQSSREFAEASARLLEDLYRELIEAFRKREIPTHDAEFPLVAVIFRSEREFRAYRKVDRDVQAYYDFISNRIYLYQESERDQHSPEVAALRKPQTVAHEGTHQILQNIGIQPRLSAWPVWLVEGLAEYCAAPVTTKKGGAGWRGMGVVNPMHMATIRDLGDPLSLRMMGPDRPKIGRDPRMPLVEYLVTRTTLDPTDYALAWALTHYLAMKRGPEFVSFVKAMSQMPPMRRSTPEDHLAAFRASFGPELGKMDRAVNGYLAKLKGYDQLPYYAVMFEQRVTGSLIKRTFVSQSPSVIRQWLESVSANEGASPTWEALPHPTRARALLAADQWLRSR